MTIHQCITLILITATLVTCTEATAQSSAPHAPFWEQLLEGSEDPVHHFPDDDTCHDGRMTAYTQSSGRSLTGMLDGYDLSVACAVENQANKGQAVVEAWFYTGPEQWKPVSWVRGIAEGQGWMHAHYEGLPVGFESFGSGQGTLLMICNIWEPTYEAELPGIQINVAAATVECQGYEVGLNVGGYNVEFSVNYVTGDNPVEDNPAPKYINATSEEANYIEIVYTSHVQVHGHCDGDPLTGAILEGVLEGQIRRGLALSAVPE